MKFFFLTWIILAVVGIQAQSGRTPAATSAASSNVAVKMLFDEANGYNKAKFEEYEAKKVPYSEKLRQQTEREQKQLAAKHAASAGARANPSPDDVYYTGLLHWISENLDLTSESLKRYLSLPGTSPEKMQTARSIVAVIAAKQRRFDEAAATVAEYLVNTPVKASDRVRMELELAKAYHSQKRFPEAAARASEAYKAARTILIDGGITQRGLDETLDAGMQLFESYRAAGNEKEADSTLEDLRKTGAAIGSASLYAYAADKLVTYMIETGRKPAAMDRYVGLLIASGKEMPTKAAQDEALKLLKKREKQYKILGDPAPELEGIDAWFPGTPKTLQALRGKVVLLDFWATWCGPCFDAFPSLTEWHRDHAEEGLVILGVTRYYGRGEGFPMDETSEISYLKRFKQKQGLPYDFVVAKGQAAQFQYAATGLPTAVLIDRKGVVRYVESGTNPTRLEELRDVMLRLLAEK